MSVLEPLIQLNRAAAQKGFEVFEIHYTPGKGYWWRLKAGNGETLCHSEMYVSKQGAQNGIAAVKQAAPAAQVYDRTL